jgi:hypothetical protein
LSERCGAIGSNPAIIIALIFFHPTWEVTDV